MASRSAESSARSKSPAKASDGENSPTSVGRPGVSKSSTRLDSSPMRLVGDGPLKAGDETSLPAEGKRQPLLTQDRRNLLARHRKLREGLMQAILDENPAEVDSFVTQGASLLQHYYSKRSEARFLVQDPATGNSRYTSKGPKTGLVNPVDWATLERRPGPALQLLRLVDGRTVFDRDEEHSYLSKVRLAQQTIFAVAQAAFLGYMELLQALLERRAHVGQTNIHGDSALLLAVRAGREEAAALLLHYGAWQWEEQKRAVLQSAASFSMDSVLRWGPHSPAHPQAWDRLKQDFADAQTCDERALRLDTLLEASRCWNPQPTQSQPNPCLVPWRGPAPNSLGGMSPSSSRLATPSVDQMKKASGTTSLASTAAPSMHSAGELSAEFQRSGRLRELETDMNEQFADREQKYLQRDALVAERDKLHSVTIAQVGEEQGEMHSMQREIDSLDAQLETNAAHIQKIKTGIYHLSAGRLEDGSERVSPLSATALGWHDETLACSADVDNLNKLRREFQQAVKRKQSTVYRGLLREGALLNVKFDLGFGEHGNFLDWVVVKDYPSIAIELMKLSDEVGFARDFAREAHAAFFWSVVQGHVEVLRVLLAHGADVAQRHNVWSSGDSALDLAVFGSRIPELCELLRYGAWAKEPHQRQTELLRWARSRPTVLEVFRKEGIVKDRAPVVAYQREAKWNLQEVKKDASADVTGVALDG